MKPVLIIYDKRNSLHFQRYAINLKHRALYADNIFEALNVTKYVAPGMVISNALITQNDYKKMTTQIFNNPLTPCFPSVFYNTPFKMDEIAIFLNKLIPQDFEGIFIDEKLINSLPTDLSNQDIIGTFN
ncbi:MAG: hypothetical protein KKA84_07235 [Bacteroidetes bacterium]|nr:hypothetical protein [Bacteroidota bacterium]